MTKRPESAEAYPDWHPAALGLTEERPEEGLLSHQNPGQATPYTGKAGTSRPAPEDQDKEAPAQKTYRGRVRNPAYKKGFRRPKPNPNSPFAPPLGASQPEEAVKKQKPKKTLMFSEGSRLAENTPADEYEAALVESLGSRPEAGKRPRQVREPESEFTRAKNIVLNQLAASAKSRAMLEKKLREKEIDEQIITDVLDRFERAKLINDEEYAQMYVRARATGKKLSRSAIARELKSKGVAEEYVAEALEQRTEEDELADARELVQKKLRPGMDLSDRKERDKVMRRLVAMLARKGYSSSLAFSVVREEVEAAAQALGAEEDYWD